MRTHIAKSLQTRCKTIRRAVTTYNNAAATLSPPLPPLDWTRVSQYGFLEEFSLLQGTRNDIRDKPWATPVVRETIKLRRRLARAKEEIERLNVEVRRLHTAIRDESRLFKATLDKLKNAKSILYGPVQEFTTYRRRVNAALLERIRQIYALPGFTGINKPGTRIGAESSILEADNDDISGPTPSVNDARDEDEDDDGGDSIIDEDEQDDIGGLIQFSRLAL